MPWSRPFEHGGAPRIENGIDAEMSYGIALPHAIGVLTPYVGIASRDGIERSERAGATWQPRENAAMGVEWRNDGAVWFRGVVHW